jgi:ankyrin repeat protein
MKKILQFLFLLSIVFPITITSSLCAAMNADDFLKLCAAGGTEDVKRAISAGADVNARDEKGSTPLMYAAFSNKEPEGVIKVLLSAGADINATNIGGRTALIEAAYKPGVAVKKTSKSGTERTSYYTNHRAIEALLKEGADVNARDADGNRAVDYLTQPWTRPAEKNPALEEASETSTKAPIEAAKDEREFLLLCERGTPEEVESAIRNGANVLTKDNNGRDALNMAAAFNPDAAVTETLLKNGANVSARNQWDRTALYEASMFSEEPAIIEALLAAGADVHAEATKNEFKNTPNALFAAVYEKRPPAIVEALIKGGANVNDKDRWGQTPLKIAFDDENSPERTVLLLLDAGANVKKNMGYNNTPLTRAVQIGMSADTIKAILEKGVDVNAVGARGATAMHWAAMKRADPEVVKALLDAGANANITDPDGKKALYYAESNETLKESGVYLQLASATSSSQISSAALDVEAFLDMCNSGKPGEVEDAIRDGADVNSTDYKGVTPLMAAAWSANSEVVSVLIAHGSKLNAVDNSGWTALTMPIFLWDSVPHFRDGIAKTVALLAEHGADVNMPDENGHTPLMLAAMYSEPRIVEILLNAGADINARDKEGESAADYAQRNDAVKNSEIYKKLAQANSTRGSFIGWIAAIGLSLLLLLLCLFLIFFKRLNFRT